MFLVQTPDGEQMLVDSLDGHADCTVIAENVTPPTDPAAVWDGTAFTVPLDTLKARKRGQVDMLLYQQFQGGFSPASGPLLGHTLQVRDDNDRTNWLTSQAAYSAQVSAGNGAVLGANFRTAANETVNCSFADGLNTLLAMASWGAGLFGKSWTVKDQIAAIADAASVEAFDTAAAWAAA